MATKKPLTAEKLYQFLADLKTSGVNLKKINIYHRPDRNSDEDIVRGVEEDLFDPETNQVLTSIMLLNNTAEDPKQPKNKLSGIQKDVISLYTIAENLENNGEDEDANYLRNKLNSILKKIN